MSDPERSTFLQETLQPDPISDGWLFVPALIIGIGLAIYAGS